MPQRRTIAKVAVRTVTVGEELPQTEQMMDNIASETESDDESLSKKGKICERFFCTDFPPCSLSFTRAEHLARHVRKHTEKRFFCTDFPPCSLGFTRAEHLARHVRKHTGERPFKCHCSRRFSRLDNLRCHALSVHRHEDIPGDSLAATETHFQRQIRADLPPALPILQPEKPNIQPRRRNSSAHSTRSGASSNGATTPDFIPFGLDTPPSGRSWFFRGEEAKAVPTAAETKNRDDYVYKAIKADEVRIFLLHQGSGKDPILISMIVIPLQEIQDQFFNYYALSYAWGTESLTESILIQDLPNDHQYVKPVSQVYPSASQQYLLESQLNYEAIRKPPLLQHQPTGWQIDSAKQSPQNTPSALSSLQTFVQSHEISLSPINSMQRLESLTKGITSNITPEFVQPEAPQSFFDDIQESELPVDVAASSLKSYSVRPNLYTALKHMRSETENLWMWIDAISIHQDDDREKSDQLPNILQIYNNAHSVCIWLGDADNYDLLLHEAHEPLDFVHFLVNLKLLDRWVNNGEPDEPIIASFVAFAKLLQRPWFRRRWVIQEISAARQASVHYGSSKVNWVDFADAVQLFLAQIDGIRTIFRKSSLFAWYPDALNHVESTGAVALVNVCNSLVKRTTQRNILTRLWSIEALVTTFVHFEASDQRDVVYALLALAADSLPKANLLEKSISRLSANYHQCSHAVYVDFVDHVIGATSSLDILCRHWAPKTQLCGEDFLSSKCRWKYPSWISSVTRSPFGPPSEMTGRLNGDSLVGEVGRPQYKASLGKAANFLIRWPDSVFGTRVAPNLTATGFILGAVCAVSSRVVDGIITHECFQMAGWNKDLGVDEFPDCLWRTLVADRTPEGKKAPSWWRRACMHCLIRTDYNGDLSTSKVIASQSLPDIVVNDYLKRVQSVVWNRRFLLMEDSQSKTKPLASILGLGPRDVREGDIICILYGCSVPVVLRKKTISTAYELIGECFVDERMDGEAVVIAESEERSDVVSFILT